MSLMKIRKKQIEDEFVREVENTSAKVEELEKRIQRLEEEMKEVKKRHENSGR